tara:strand:+ start:10748 stop:11626 length:879 start_codon:yes stop_codon:yes gene_type:complete
MAIKKKKIEIHLLLFLFIGISCSNGSNYLSIIINKSDSSNINFEKGKENWEKRANKNNIYESLKYLRKAIKENGENLERSKLMSQACHFTAEYIEDDETKSDSLYLLGKDIAWNFLIKTDSYIKGFNSFIGDVVDKKIAGIDNISENDIEVLFWWVKNYVSFIANKPVTERLTAREEIETALYRVLSQKPDFYFGGCHQIFGILYARLPGVELNKSISQFETAITKGPDFFGNYVARAKYLYPRVSDKESFEKDINYIISLDPSTVPEIAPENLMEQEIAKKLLQKSSNLFK